MLSELNIASTLMEFSLSTARRCLRKPKLPYISVGCAHLPTNRHSTYLILGKVVEIILLNSSQQHERGLGELHIYLQSYLADLLNRYAESEEIIAWLHERQIQRSDFTTINTQSLQEGSPSSVRYDSKNKNAFAD